MGESLELAIQPPGDKEMTHHPTVLAAEPGRRLVWLGKLSIPGAFAARHELLLESAPGGGTLLRHRETFTGVLVPFLRRTLNRTELGFVAMNQALKTRAEG